MDVTIAEAAGLRGRIARSDDFSHHFGTATERSNSEIRD